MMNTVATVAARRRRPVWLGLLVALFAAAVLLAGSLLGWLASLERVPVHVVIDGTEQWTFDPADFSTGHWATLVVGVVLASLVAVIAIPVVLLIGLAGLAIGLVVGLGVPLLLVVVMLAVACSPVLLLAALVVWLWRSASAPRAARAATMAG